MTESAKMTRRGLLAGMGATATVLAAGVLWKGEIPGARADGRSTVSMHTYGGEAGKACAAGCGSEGYVNVMDFIPAAERA
ncbi:MAG: hypothetical protein K0Q59_5930, partial [Paenibacillus sp.]|nr:hypothetical protein [Paenibacillus sp.]